MHTIQRKSVLGLIGGIGSGKSAVATLFQNQGALIIGGDPIGHEALYQPDIKTKILYLWGTSILNEQGEISRPKLANLVFADPAERNELEKIVFPYITMKIAEKIDQAQQDLTVSFIVLDAAVLLESGWDRYCDWIVYVHVPLSLRWQRLRQQRSWTKEEFHQRTRAQISLTDKVTRADFVIDNSGDLATVVPQVEKILAQVQKTPQKPLLPRS